MGRIIWGIILIGLGILFFGRNLGWTNIDIGEFFGQYWPLILVIIGLLILADVFKSLILRAISLVILIVLFAVPFIFADSWSDQNQVNTNSQTQNVELENAKSLKFDLNAGAVMVDIDDQADNSRAIQGKLTSSFLNLVKSERRQGDQLKVGFSLSGNKKVWPLSGSSFKNRLEINLNPNITHELDLNLGASTVNAELQNLKVENLNIDTGATTINLTLGDKADKSNVQIEGGAATVNLDIPRSVGAQVELEGALTSRNLEGFDKVTDDLYQTANYGSAEKKITINANLGAASFNIDRY